MKQKNEPTKAKTDTSPTLPGMTPHDQSRRTLEGHTRPCEDCGAVNWDFDISRGEITMRRLWTGGRGKRPRPGRRMDQQRQRRDRSRVGRPMTYTLADKGLNTTIDVRDLNTGIASVTA